MDACVLMPPYLCDLLLRLAETPRLYVPRWSKDILDEVKTNQIGKFKWTDQSASYWREQVEKAFPDSSVADYDVFIPLCDVHVDDRHVLAAAIKSQSHTIVTSNLRHFPAEVLERWDIVATHPSDYLITLLDMETAIFVSKFDDMVAKRGKTREEMLRQMNKTVPGFVASFADKLGADL